MAAARASAELPDADFAALQRFSQRIRDSASRRDWILSLPPQVSRRMISAEAVRWLNHAPDEFAEYVSSIPPGRAQASFISDTLGKGSFGNKQALRDWAVSNLPEESLKRIPELKR